MEYDHERNKKTTEPKYECLLFDVDDTLYPLSSGLSAQCTKNIIEYMVHKLVIEEEKISVMNAQLYKEYGTTMAGLKAIGYDFDYDDYHSFVHGRLPYEWLKTDHTLRNLLHSLPIRKVIFSNGNDAHVAKVLGRLGLEDCFDDVISFETLNPTKKCDEPSDNHGVEKIHDSPVVCKPFENAFEEAFKIAKINPQRTLFFDDSIRNIQTAKTVGLHTVWIGSSHKMDGVDYAVESIHNIREAVPELREVVERSDDVPSSRKAAIETYVRA